MNCNRCRFWSPNRETGKPWVGIVQAETYHGRCLRLPPMPDAQDEIGRRWPVVLGVDWCGEFKDCSEAV